MNHSQLTIPLDIVLVAIWTSFITSSRSDVISWLSIAKNETYRPLRSGRYLNEPQGLAKIYPAIADKVLAK